MELINFEYITHVRGKYMSQEMWTSMKSLGLTSGENSDNMTAWSQDDDTLFGDEDEMIYDNPSFNGIPLNETVGDRNTNQQDLETSSHQLNEG